MTSRGAKRGWMVAGEIVRRERREREWGRWGRRKGAADAAGTAPASRERLQRAPKSEARAPERKNSFGRNFGFLELSSGTQVLRSSGMVGGTIPRSGELVGGRGDDAQGEQNLHKHTHKTRHTQQKNTKQKHNHHHKNISNCYSKNQPLWLPQRSRAPRGRKPPPRRPPQRLTSRIPQP